MKACIVCGRPSPSSRCPRHRLGEHPRGNGWEPVRQAVAHRDGWVCQDEDCVFPGEPIDPTTKAPHPKALAVDHIVSRARGGTNDPSNLRATHALCNLRKGDR